MIAHRKSLLKRSPFWYCCSSFQLLLSRNHSVCLYMHAHTGHTSTFPVRRSFVHVVQHPYHQVRARYYSFNRTALQGFSSGWPLSVYSPLFAKQAFIVGPYSHGLFPHWATLYAPHGIPAVVQSLSSSVGNPLLLVLNRLGTTQPFKCDAPIVLHPLTPSLAFAL